jgi:hypothetical protein
MIDELSVGDNLCTGGNFSRCCCNFRAGDYSMEEIVKKQYKKRKAQVLSYEEFKQALKDRGFTFGMENGEEVVYGLRLKTEEERKEQNK